MAGKIHVQQITIGGTAVEALSATAAGSPRTTDAIDVSDSDGYASVFILLADTPSIDLAYSISVDGGTNFYTPYDSAGTDISSIVTTLTETTGRIQAIDVSLATHLRFTLTSNADSTVTLRLIQKQASV